MSQRVLHQTSPGSTNGSGGGLARRVAEQEAQIRSLRTSVRLLLVVQILWFAVAVGAVIWALDVSITLGGREKAAAAAEPTLGPVLARPTPEPTPEVAPPATPEEVPAPEPEDAPDAAPTEEEPTEVEAPAPVGVRALVARGWESAGRADYYNAQPWFERALAESPGDAHANYGLAYVLLESGQKGAGAGPACAALQASSTDVELNREVRSLIDRHGVRCY